MTTSVGTNMKNRVPIEIIPRYGLFENAIDMIGESMKIEILAL